MSNENKQNKSIMAKSISRYVAIQELYGVFVNSDDSSLNSLKLSRALKLFNHIGDGEKSSGKEQAEINFPTAPDQKFLEKLLDGYNQNGKEIEKVIKENISKLWEVKRMDKLLLAILSIAVCEINYVETKAKTVIDEYVSLTASFYGDKETGFINGFLDKVALG